MDAETRVLASTPSSTTSGCMSGESTSEDNILPSSLASEELQLALNKDATEEELQKAITRCKELVLGCDQCSSERKWLVRHLIELRLRLQECQDALDDPLHPHNKSSGASRRIVRGHHLHLQPLLRTATSKYCDHCTGMIWSVVQAWYECEDCGYCCHHKCLAFIIRECAHVTVSEKGCYELDICPEEGLSAQKYQCAECKTPISVSNGLQGRKCDYTGLYYCTACHWGSSAIIPARIIHNWDFTPHPVSQASLQQLRITATRPWVNLNKLNPRLFSLLLELDLVKRIRHVLHAMPTHGAEGLQITNFRVPGGASHEAPLDCRYDLENSQLYDVKWYKDGQEFFRCLPGGEVNEYPVEGIKIYHTGHAIVGACTVKLMALNLKSAGEYKCEVTSEGPHFKTVAQTAKLRIIQSPRRNQNQTNGTNISMNVNTTWNAYSSRGCHTPYSFNYTLIIAYLLFIIVCTFL